MTTTDEHAPPGAFLVELRANKEFWRWANCQGMRIFGTTNIEWMWIKCFDERLTDLYTRDLTIHELGLIRNLKGVLREYNIAKDHDFHAFIHDKKR